jgi:hypothetical protein
MRLKRLFLAVLWVSLSVLSLQCRPPLAALPSTLLRLTDESTGRGIVKVGLRDGQEVVLTWQNSLFNLPVEEVFVAEGGCLVLRTVTFADPSGTPPPLVRPEDLDDLYHTGGPFRAEGLSRPFTRLVFRVGEIGKPKLRIGSRVFDLEKEVGFGGAVVLWIRGVDSGGSQELRGWE